MFLSKRQMKTAFRLSDTLFDNNFRRISVDDKKIKIAEVYLDYLRDYFSENSI